MEVYSSPHHHFRKLLGYLPGAYQGVGPEGSSGRSGTVDWLCLGPAQQRSCIASWGCSPSSRGPDLTIPPCGCSRMAMGSVLCPHKIRQGLVLYLVSVTAGAQGRVNAPHCQLELAGSGSLHALRGGGGSTTKYFLLRWQPSIILPKPANFFKSQCRKKKSPCYFIQTGLTWITYTFHLLLALYRT